jgi:hypothetical protein
MNPTAMNLTIVIAPKPPNHPVICPQCHHIGGHAAGACRGEHRDPPSKRKPCRCKVECRPGKSEFVVRGLSKTYYQQMTGIGPMFGGTKKQAFRFKTQWQLASVMSTWPITASVGCTVESVPIGGAP